MEITVLRNLGPGLPDYKEGQVVEVNDKEGDDLIKAGLALIKGIPKKPKITAPALPKGDDPTVLDSDSSDSQKRFKEKSTKRK